MLTACGASGEAKLQSAPDPVVTTRVEYRTICPSELALEDPVRPVPAADAVIDGNDAGFAWLNSMTGFAQLLLDRLHDAKAEC